MLSFVIELAILGLLKEHPMHGYDLRKRLREDFGLLSTLSFGSLYPALARLESGGALREVAPGRGEAPQVTSIFGSVGSIAGERAAFRARLASRRSAASRSAAGTRGRRVYEITESGSDLFQRLLESAETKPEGSRGFALRWAFARYMSPEARLSLLWRRRAQLVDEREGSRKVVESSRRALDRFQRSLVDHATEAAEHDLSWIDRLIAAEEAAQTSPPVPGRGAHPLPTFDNPTGIVAAAVGHAGPAVQRTAMERNER